MVKHLEIDLNAINQIPLKFGRTVYVHKADYECLYEHCCGMEDYIEIGTMHGASAIVAGYGVSREVHCIDPFGVKGQPARKDKSGFFVHPDNVRGNWELHHDLDRLHIHQQRHPPWPKAIEDKMFDVGLIDGCHGYPAVMDDFKGMKEHVKYKLLFHDVRPVTDDGNNPTRAFHEIAKLPEWEILEVRGVMGVLTRVE
jgi:hypothetical protein